MTIDETQRLWPVAQILHEARVHIAWGKNTLREPWPEFSTSYSHNPIAFVDIALEQARAIDEYYKQHK